MYNNKDNSFSGWFYLNINILYSDKTLLSLSLFLEGAELSSAAAGQPEVE